jgi:NTE family protein
VIGLALEGGGALGLAHIGVLQWFEDHHIPIDRLAGTSMGSLVGAFYASGLTPAQLRTLATGNAFQSVFVLQAPYADVSFRRRQDRRELPQALTAGLRHGFQFRNALIDERGVNEFLASNLAAYNSGAVDFNRLPIPFRCVATDLNTLGPLVFASGSLPAAVRASISIPGVLAPVLDARGHSLVDGGIMNNLPTGVVRNDLHADIVIALHLDNGGPVAGVDTSSIVSVLDRAFSAGIDRNVQESMRAADLVLAIPIGKFTGMDYDKGGQLIREGYLAAERNHEALLKYALAPDAWAAYLADRNARQRPVPGILRVVHVEGGTPLARQTVVSDLAPLKGKPIQSTTTSAALKPIQANGDYAASYQTTLSSAPGGPAGQLEPDNALLVRLTRDPIGPPYLLLSPEFSGTTDNLMRVALNLRLIGQNFGGYGSEFRASARVGYMNAISAEYYRRISDSGYFIQPIAQAGTEPVYIWQEQQRIAERSQSTFMGGLAVGRTFSNTLQLSGEWRYQHTHWTLVTGSGGGSSLTGTAQSGLLRLDIDRAQSNTISPSGWRLSAGLGALYNAVASSNAPLLRLSVNRSFSVKPEHILAIGGEVDSYFRANVAQPFRFTLGGPLRLSSASFDEYRGTDLYLARAGYLRRIAALPTGLGHGLYASFGYEAGQVWSPEQRTFLRQDGVTGLVGNTPIGLITIGVSVGDAAHRKVFFTLGRAF